MGVFFLFFFLKPTADTHPLRPADTVCRRPAFVDWSGVTSHLRPPRDTALSKHGGGRRALSLSPRGGGASRLRSIIIIGGRVSRSPVCLRVSVRRCNNRAVVHVDALAYDSHAGHCDTAVPACFCLEAALLRAPASSYVIAPHIPLSRRVVNKGRHVVQWSTCRRSRGREQSWLLFPFLWNLPHKALMMTHHFWINMPSSYSEKKLFMYTLRIPICKQRKQPYETLETLSFPLPLAGSILNLRLTLFIGRTPILKYQHRRVNSSLKETLALIYWLLMAVRVKYGAAFKSIKQNAILLLPYLQ